MEKKPVGLALPRGRKARARVGKRKGIWIEETAWLQEDVSMSVGLAPVGGQLCTGARHLAWSHGGGGFKAS